MKLIDKILLGIYIDLNSSDKTNRLDNYPNSLSVLFKTFESDKLTKLCLNFIINGYTDEHELLLNPIKKFVTNEFINFTEEPDQMVNASALSQFISYYISNTNPYEVIKECNNLLSINSKTKIQYIIVNSPEKLSKDSKTDIRRFFNSKYEYACPIYKIDKNILGGIKIFVDGELFDDSWLTKIEQINIFNY